MRGTSAFLAILTLILISIAGISCDSKPNGAPPLANIDPSLALRFGERAMRQAGGYRLQVEESNFVLPRWGGSEGGTIEVSGDGAAAVADLTRTGEDGATYTITLVKGETYFKRSTCEQTFHISNGADVLKPFLLVRNDVFSNAKNARLEGALIRADLAGLGSVTVELDNSSYLPVEIRGTSNGRDLVWHFEKWHVKPKATKPSGKVEDRGPGGNPC